MLRIFLLLTACGLLSRAQNNFLISRPVPDPAAVERGKALFVPSCGFCHGPDATGAEGPDLVRSAVALRDEGGDEIGPVVRAGRPGMPAFPQMSDVQVKDLAAFIRFRQQAAIDRTTYELKNVNTGDATRGKAYFGLHCAACHSATGDMKGIAARFEASALMARILYPRGAKATATVVAEGKSVNGVLEYRDDFEAGVRDAQGVYHAFSLSPKVKLTVTDPLEAHVKQMKAFQDRDLHDVLAFLETLR